MCGFIAQPVEHHTGIAEVTGSNPVETLIFFRLFLSNYLSWKITAIIILHFQYRYCLQYSSYISGYLSWTQFTQSISNSRNKMKYIMIFREEATSALALLHAGDLCLGQIRIFIVDFVEEGKPENTEKNRGENH